MEREWQIKRTTTVESYCNVMTHCKDIEKAEKEAIDKAEHSPIKI